AQRGKPGDLDLRETFGRRVRAGQRVGIYTQIRGSRRRRQRRYRRESRIAEAHIQDRRWVQRVHVVERLSIVLQRQRLTAGSGKERVLARLNALARNEVPEQLLLWREL